MADLHREEDGTLPAYAWPGGYQMYYLLADDGTICPPCANGQNGSLASEKAEDKQWKITAADINYEDDDLFCDHCNAKIPAAYSGGDKGE